MPADRHPPRPGRTLPDGVVVWLGALVLMASSLARLDRTAALGVRRFVVGSLWPATRSLVVELRLLGTEVGRQVAGVVSRAMRSAPAWLSTRRIRSALWVASAEVVVRRVLRRASSTSRRQTAAVLRSAPLHRWTRRVVRTGAAAAVVMIALVVASGPLLDATATAVLGDNVRDELRPLAQTSVVVGGDGRPVGVVERERRRSVDTDSLPDHVTDLVLAAEDQRFEGHEGYDLGGLARAALTNARAGEVEQGGSTITQQLAKMNFTDGARSVKRKVQELLYAVRLEDELPKDQLLERYLNQVYFGNGAHGIAAAADEYFATAPQHLSVAQAAVLAGIIQAPTALDPRRAPEDVQRRRDRVLRTAADEGLLDPAAAAAAVAEPFAIAPDTPRPRADPILDAVRAEVRTIEALGATPRQRIERLETGGLVVETTLDPALQHEVATAIDTTAPGESAGPTAAVVAVDPGSGAIRALRSGRDGPGGFDLARQGRRQPGSTFKPLTAVAGLEAGLSPEQRLIGDGPIELDHGGPEPWRVDNFGGTDVGPVDLRVALRRSVNTAFAQLGTAVGTDAITDVLDRAGVDGDAALGPPEQRGPSVALGGIAYGVTPLELAGAYTAFANEGRVAEPYLVERIIDASGEVVYERDRRTDTAIDPTIAGQVRAMLEEALHSGTGRGARIEGVAAFGKTGTSQDGADAWFVGSTTNLTTAVWVGHPDGREPMPAATGGELAAPIWRQVTAAWVAAHPAGTWPPAPDDRDASGLDLPKPDRAD